MSINTLLKNDSRVRKLNKLLSKGSFNLNTVEWLRELEIMHLGRLTRKLTVGDVVHRFQSSFMKSVLQNQANRSRAVEIKMHCLRTQARLSRHLDKLKRLLAARYHEPLQRAVKTKAERDDLVRSVLFKAEDLLQEITTTMQIADLVVADIDQTGWTVKSIITIMELISKQTKEY